MKKITLYLIIWITICLSVNGQITKSILTNQNDLIIEKVGDYDKILIFLSDGEVVNKKVVKNSL